MPTSRGFLGGAAPAEPTDEPAKPFRAPRGGRRIELTEELIGTFERALLTGMPMKQAAMVTGVSVGTVQTWLADGQREDCTDPLRRELFQRASVARGNQTLWGIQKLKDIVEAGEAGAVPAIRLLLQAQDPETWGDKSTQRVEVQHSEAPAKAKALEGFTLDELREMRRITAARQARQLGDGSPPSEDAEG